ncbi:MAG: hypothetical protein RLW61_07805 [Gammaproteobacteria bacterium]|jgi:hypothetical protein
MRHEVIAVIGDRVAVRGPLGIVVFEIIGPHATRVGDVVAGILDETGSAAVENVTRHEYLDVFVEDCGCSPDELLELLDEGAA